MFAATNNRGNRAGVASTLGPEKKETKEVSDRRSVA